MKDINPLNDSMQICAELAAAINGYKKILLCSHPRMDGDAVGSMLAIYSLIQDNLDGNIEIIPLAQTEYINELKYLPNSDKVVYNEDIEADYQPDAIIVLDIGGINRAEELFKKYPQAEVINIDHHASNEGFGKICLNRPDFGSVCELLYYFARILGWKISLDIAECLFAGILTDSGRFTFSNTTDKTYLAASALYQLGVQPSEAARHIYRNITLKDLHLEARIIDRIELLAEGLFAVSHLTKDDLNGDLIFDSNYFVNILKSIKGTQIAALIYPGHKENELKISVRGEGFHDLGAISKEFFNGGGHPRAAGLTIISTFEDAKAQLVAKFASLCNENLQNLY